MNQLFVSYVIDLDKGGILHGNCCLTWDHLLSSTEAMRDLEAFLSENSGIAGRVIVTNWRRLE